MLRSIEPIQDGLQRVLFGELVQPDNRLRIVGTKSRCGSTRQVFRRGGDHVVEATLLDDGLDLL